MTKLQSLSVPYKNTRLIGDRWPVEGQVGEALLLHGGGTSSGQGFQELRESLAAARIGSLAFDCIGHGRTGGELADSSLADRVEQALAVLDQQQVTLDTLSVVGFSMGAYVAARLAARLPQLHGLGLAIPAAYTPEAFELPFGPAFSAAIRRPFSWRDSAAFGIVAGFGGRLLVLSAEQDQVVPAEIPARYFESGTQAAWRAHHIVPGALHDLSAHYLRVPESRAPAYARVAALCGTAD